MAEVLNRQKDVQYSSRIASHIARQQQAHRLRHVISQLAARLPEAERNSAAVRELAGYGCSTQMHVVRLLAPQLDRENHTKDIDFSPSGIMQRWDAGYAAYQGGAGPLRPGSASSIRSSGVILHEQVELMPLAAGPRSLRPDAHPDAGRLSRRVRRSAHGRKRQPCGQQACKGQGCGNAGNAGGPSKPIEKLSKHRTADETAKEITGEIGAAGDAAIFGGRPPDKPGRGCLRGERAGTD